MKPSEILPMSENILLSTPTSDQGCAPDRASGNDADVRQRKRFWAQIGEDTSAVDTLPASGVWRADIKGIAPVDRS